MNLNKLTEERPFLNDPQNWLEENSEYSVSYQPQYYMKLTYLVSTSEESWILDEDQLYDLAFLIWFNKTSQEG